MNNGKIIWQIPFGEYSELTNKGFKKTGTENFGGVTATRGEILLATGTLDKKFYVFDSTDGKLLYDYELPFIGSSPPTTYISNNEQFVYCALYSLGYACSSVIVCYFHRYI